MFVSLSGFYIFKLDKNNVMAIHFKILFFPNDICKRKKYLSLKYVQISWIYAKVGDLWECLFGPNRFNLSKMIRQQFGILYAQSQGIVVILLRSINKNEQYNFPEYHVN